MATIYTDIPLNTQTSTNIRVMELLQQTTEFEGQAKDIACKVYVIPADSSVSYTAVSYMWGDATETVDILMNEKPFPVTTNLFELLKELAAQKFYGLLWIDAICINQASVLERNHQVAIMGSIYSRASKVLVWLGPPTANMSQSLLFFEELYSTSLDWLAVHAPDSGSKIPLEGILEICKHPYWNRAWIVQEVVLSPVVWIYSGSCYTTLTRFVEQCNTLGEGSLATTSLVRQILKSRVFEVFAIREKWLSPRRTYYNPLTGFEMLDCADVRDRVYAMISLMDPNIGLIPDYNLNNVELFSHVIEQISSTIPVIGNNQELITTSTLHIKLGIDPEEHWPALQTAWKSKGTCRYSYLSTSNDMTKPPRVQLNFVQTAKDIKFSQMPNFGTKHCQSYFNFAMSQVLWDLEIEPPRLTWPEQDRLEQRIERDAVLKRMIGRKTANLMSPSERRLRKADVPIH